MFRPAVRLLALIWTRLLDDRLRTHLMWWLNAKFAVGVTAIVRSPAGAILLVASRPPRRSAWTLPGGWVGRREPLEAAVVRLIRESAGLDVAVDRLITARAFELPRLDVVYACTVRGRSARPSGAAPRCGWYPPEALPAAFDPDAAELIRRWIVEVDGAPPAGEAAPLGPVLGAGV